MSAEKEERFQLSITGKYRGAAHFSCDANLKLSKKIPVIFHNLRGYDSQFDVTL